MKNNLQTQIDESLSGLRWTEAKQRAVLDGIKEGTVVKKKLSTGALIVLVLIFAAITALAVSGVIHTFTNTVEQMMLEGDLERWGFEDKLRFITAMESAGLEMDEALLKNARDESLSQEARDMAIEAIIAERYGSLILQANEDFPLDEEDQMVAPAPHIVFKEAYLRDHPDATDDEVRSAYQATVAETREDWNEANPSEFNREPGAVQTEAAILELAKSTLTEINGLNRAEVEKAQLSAQWLEDKQVWVASVTIKAEDLRPGKQELFANTYGKSDVYTYGFLCDKTGDIVSWESDIEAYEFTNLIPREAFPDGKREHDGFRRASVEEKAAFSQQWKPVVDAWLEQHPGFDIKDKERANTAISYTTYHAYGLPGADAISQDEAYEIAVARFVDDVAEADLELVKLYSYANYFYDITDPDKPLWKVSINQDRELTTGITVPKWLSGGYFVCMDAVTGEVIDAYDYSGSGSWIPEKYM